MLADQEDAYGHAIHDYLRGVGGYEIVEREDGYIDISGGPPYYFSEYKKWPFHQREGMRFVRGKVLDIGCGAGRVALHLQNLNFDVTGIDISPLAIEVCRQRGLREALVLPITALSPKIGVFDSLLLYGNNFGLLSNWKRSRWLLKRFHKMTSNQARIIAESRDPYDTKEPHHLIYHAYNRQRGRLSGQIRLRIRYKKYQTPWFDYLFVSRQEMVELLSDTGWRVERFIDSDHPSYLAILEKSGHSIGQ
jgi:SAM-dependent methyltransferase